MTSKLRHPDFWRSRAVLASLMATHHRDLEEREHQLRLAAMYRSVARYAEERLANVG
jgi:hypothetical protein